MKFKKIYVYTLIAATSLTITNKVSAENNSIVKLEEPTILSIKAADPRSVDTSKLKATITTAENLLSKAVVGTSDGMYKQESVDELKVAINESKATINFDEITQELVDSQYLKLEDAIQVFKNSEIANYINHKEILKLNIQDCSNILSSSKTGTAIGEYPSSVMDKFKSAIKTAENIAAKTEKDSNLYINALNNLLSSKQAFQQGVITNQDLEYHKNKLNVLLDEITSLIKNSTVGSVNNGVSENQKIALSVMYSNLIKMTESTQDTEEYNKAYKMAQNTISDFNDGSISIDNNNVINGNKLTGINIAKQSTTDNINIVDKEEFIPQAGLPINIKSLFVSIGVIFMAISSILFSKIKKQKV